MRLNADKDELFIDGRRITPLTLVDCEVPRVGIRINDLVMLVANWPVSRIRVEASLFHAVFYVPKKSVKFMSLWVESKRDFRFDYRVEPLNRPMKKRLVEYEHIQEPEPHSIDFKITNVECSPSGLEYLKNIMDGKNES